MGFFSKNRNCSQGSNFRFNNHGNRHSGRHIERIVMGLGIFHDDYRLIANPVDVHNATLKQMITSLPDQVGGTGTNLTAGLLGAVRMADRAPAGCLKKTVIVLSDGVPNIDENGLFNAICQARKSDLTIHTIGFGDPGTSHYDPKLLERIAKATNGSFLPVDSLRSLSKALVDHSLEQNRRNDQKEITVLAIDCSLSMTAPMEGKRRIEVVVEALMHLLSYKQQDGVGLS
jgi:Mg-chelatase subunit ChlD